MLECIIYFKKRRKYFQHILRNFQTRIHNYSYIVYNNMSRLFLYLFVKYFQIATFISLFKYCLNRTNLKIIDQFMARKKSFVSFGVWKIPQPRDACSDFIFLNNYNSVVNNILYFLYLMEEQWPKRIRFHNFQQTFRPETSTSSII